MTVSLVASWLFLAASLWGAWFTWNAYFPIFSRPRLSVLSFFAGWLTTELAAHHILWQVLFTAGFVWVGALSAWPGWIGLAITLVSWAGLLGCLASARKAETIVDAALRAGLGEGYGADILPAVGARLAPAIEWDQLLLPIPTRHPEVRRVRDVVYARASGRDLHLDVYHNRERRAGSPILMYVHGGAWVLGSKNEQGLPMMRNLASRGWVCVTVNYRLSPHATFPDPLIDLKRAIAWVREHAPAYGGDPDLLVVSGGSAGGHLASLLALTANDVVYQPGFERVDTAVAGCVSFYGVYDFTNRFGVWPHEGLQPLLEQHVMKAGRHEAPDAYEAASPVARIHPDAPPFFVIHGSSDTLVPVAEARHFVERFREIARAPIAYAEIPGAQHAFEIFYSLRTTYVLHGVERFLAWAVSRQLTARAAEARRTA